MNSSSPRRLPNLLGAAAALVLSAVSAGAAMPALAAVSQSSFVVPIVLSSSGAGGSNFSTELILTNGGATTATVALRYTAAFGGGSGTGVEALAPGEQKVIPDAIAYLIGRGIPIPASGDRGGTLQVGFYGLSSPDAAAVTARTTTATRAPHPIGAAGLAYPGTAEGSVVKTSATLFGIRATSEDRSNVAVYNPTTSEVTIRVTAFAGDGSGASLTKADDLTIPALGWTQFNGILDGTGFTSGWVTVERKGGQGAFGTYGVVNSNGTNDGSFLPFTIGDIPGDRITVPVLVETTSGFLSEMIFANRSRSEATFELSYRESLAPSLGTGGNVTLKLRPGEQLILPDALEVLRGQGLRIGARGAASYAGALRVRVTGAGLADVYAGARTASRSPAGGQFGLFTPGIYEGQEATTEAILYGLRSDANNRTNVAVVNAGADGSGAVTLELRAHDGDAGGVAKGDPRVVVLEPGAWTQESGFLATRGVKNGWVRVTRLSGTAPWIAYGVVNDGGGPGERTGDGAHVPMVVTTPPSAWVVTVLEEPAGAAHSPALTFDPEGSPTIAYVRVSETLGSQTKVARWDRETSSWQVSPLQPEAGDNAWHAPAVATDPGDGSPSVVYGSDAITFAHWDGTSWVDETIDAVGAFDHSPSLAYGPDGSPSISYVAQGGFPGIRFASKKGSSWFIDSVDPDATVGPVSSLAFDANGNPAVAYGSRSPGSARVDTLKLARRTGSTWNVVVVESGVFDYGTRPSLAFDAEGLPAISHGRGVDGPPGIRIVRWNGSRWIAELITPDGESGGLVFDRSGVPNSAFAVGTPASVQVSRREPEGWWEAEVVEDTLARASRPNLTLDPSGRPALVYERVERTIVGDTASMIGFARRTAQ